MEEIMASNPVFNRIEKEAQQGYAGFGSPRAESPPMGAAQAGTASQAGYDQLTAEQLQQMYSQPSASAVQAGRVTLDDVVMKTLALFSIVVVVGAIGWVAVDVSPGLAMPLMLGGIVVTLGLGLAIAFK